MREVCSGCSRRSDKLTAVGADPHANFNLCPACVRKNDEEFFREMGWNYPPATSPGGPSTNMPGYVDPKDWRYHGNVIDLGEPCEVCQLCGQLDLRYHFEIVHQTTGTGMWVGSECIKRFEIEVVRDGRVLDRRAAHRQVDKDRRAVEKRARTRSVINSLVQLAAADPSFDINDFIRYYADRGAFTPRQMLLLQWRFSEKRIDHAPSHFKISLQRGREQADLERMEPWRRTKLAPYLSAAQRKRWLS